MKGKRKLPPTPAPAGPAQLSPCCKILMQKSFEYPGKVACGGCSKLYDAPGAAPAAAPSSTAAAKKPAKKKAPAKKPAPPPAAEKTAAEAQPGEAVLP